jgi:hypothetical protein
MKRAMIRLRYISVSLEERWSQKAFFLLFLLHFVRIRIMKHDLHHNDHKNARSIAIETDASLVGPFQFKKRPVLSQLPTQRCFGSAGVSVQN